VDRQLGPPDSFFVTNLRRLLRQGWQRRPSV
jgi:hypothetical protein